jgi:hypothetical protein
MGFLELKRKLVMAIFEREDVNSILKLHTFTGISVGEEFAHVLFCWSDTFFKFSEVVEECAPRSFGQRKMFWVLVERDESELMRNKPWMLPS